jgi:hypothetical protein
MEMMETRRTNRLPACRGAWKQRVATVQALIFRWTKTANHGKLILGAAGQ